MSTNINKDEGFGKSVLDELTRVYESNENSSLRKYLYINLCNKFLYSDNIGVGNMHGIEKEVLIPNVFILFQYLGMIDMTIKNLKENEISTENSEKEVLREVIEHTLMFFYNTKSGSTQYNYLRVQGMRISPKNKEDILNSVKQFVGIIEALEV